jgi:hypothetical protein
MERISSYQMARFLPPPLTALPASSNRSNRWSERHSLQPLSLDLLQHDRQCHRHIQSHRKGWRCCQQHCAELHRRRHLCQRRRAYSLRVCRQTFHPNPASSVYANRSSGLLRTTNSSSYPDADEVLVYERYQWGPARTSWKPGFLQEKLSPNLTRYITHGAAVSVPSENRAFYFSGMHAPDGGEITTALPQANVTAKSLISVDMSVMRSPKWTNATLPDYVPGRANAELVWLPVSQSGVLLAIGGVANPEDIYGGLGLSTAQVQENVSQPASQAPPLCQVDD